MKFNIKIINKRFLTIFQNNGSIENLVRISELRLKDIIATPCFQIYDVNKIQNKKNLCGASILEKETWI